jgi:hypothetical protein
MVPAMSTGTTTHIPSGISKLTTWAASRIAP